MNNKNVVLILLLLIVIAMSLVPMTVSAASDNSHNQQIAADICQMRGIKDCAVVAYGSTAVVAVRFDMVYSASKAEQLKGKIYTYMEENYPEYTDVRITTKLSHLRLVEGAQSQIDSGKSPMEVIDNLFVERVRNK